MTGHLKADEWVVHGVDASEARRLVREQHYGGDAPGVMSAIYRHGLFREGEWFGAECLGVAVWINAVNLSKRFSVKGGPLMLTRLVVDPSVPTNGASFLLGRSMRLIDRERWPVLVTYADTGQGHTGAIYKATNWTLDGVGGGVCYYRKTDNKQLSSFGSGGRFRPCPDGYEPRETKKLRFIHDVRRKET